MSESENSSEDSDERIALHLEYFAERTNLLFAYHFCTIEFEDDEEFHLEVTGINRTWILRTIQNACLHTSLIALRDLEDFFTPRNKHTKPDDLRASDFGFPKPLGFLSVAERNSINKLIAHTTQLGGPRRGHTWDILELISKAWAQCETFLGWIESEYGHEYFYTWTTALSARTGTNSILEWIQRESEKRKQKAEQGDAGDPLPADSSRAD